MHRPGSRNLRKGRVSEPGRIYLVTACCDKRERVFESATNAEIVIDELLTHTSDAAAASLAYVVMPDHLHWLIQITAAVPLQKIVGCMKGRSAYRINELHGRSGKIWQAGFHDHALRREESIEGTANYIIHNPVRAGIVANVEQYPYWDTVWHRRYAARHAAGPSVPV